MSCPFEQYGQFLVDENSASPFGPGSGSGSGSGGSGSMLIPQNTGGALSPQLIQQQQQQQQQQQGQQQQQQNQAQFRNAFQFQGQPATLIQNQNRIQAQGQQQGSPNPVQMNQSQFQLNASQLQSQSQSPSMQNAAQAKYAQYLQQQLQQQQQQFQNQNAGGANDATQSQGIPQGLGSSSNSSPIQRTNQGIMVPGSAGSAQFQLSQALQSGMLQNQRAGQLGGPGIGQGILNLGGVPGGPASSASQSAGLSGLSGLSGPMRPTGALPATGTAVPPTSLNQAPVSGSPGAVPSDPARVTQRVALPKEILSSLKELPQTNLEEKTLVNLLAKDAEQELIFTKQEQRHSALIYRKQVEYDYYDQVRQIRQVQPSAVFGDGYSGYGNSWTGSRMNLIYPRDRKRAKRVSSELFLSKEQLEYISSIPELLAPVRLDIDMDKYRLRDTFTWNINEKVISVELFAQNLAEDYSLPLSFAPLIANHINEVLNDFHPHAYSETREETMVDLTGDADTGASNDAGVGASDAVVAASSSTPNGTAVILSNQNDDMRITIKLDITIGQHNLVDQFEWDLNCVDNNPEQFAESMCRDLSLSGEFATAIAHAIREQTQLFTKTLFLVGHQFDGRPIEDDDIIRELCPTVTSDSFLRGNTSLKNFSPVLFEIPHVELDRQDKDRDRDSRRKRRQGRAGRRGGPTLPDLRESVRTFRTPVYSALLPGGIDKVLELVRKQVTKAEESDEEDDTPRPTGSRRGRPPAHAQYNAVNHLRASSAALQTNSSRMASPQFRYHQQQLPSSEDRYIVKLRVPPRIRDEVNRLLS